MSIDRAARRQERNQLGLNIQRQITNVIGQAVCVRPEMRTMKLGSASVEWTEVRGRVEYRLGIHINTTVEIVHYDDPEPEDA